MGSEDGSSGSNKSDYSGEVCSATLTDVRDDVQDGLHQGKSIEEIAEQIRLAYLLEQPALPTENDAHSHDSAEDESPPETAPLPDGEVPVEAVDASGEPTFYDCAVVEDGVIALHHRYESTPMAASDGSVRCELVPSNDTWDIVRVVDGVASVTTLDFLGDARDGTQGGVWGGCGSEPIRLGSWRGEQKFRDINREFLNNQAGTISKHLGGLVYAVYTRGRREGWEVDGAVSMRFELRGTDGNSVLAQSTEFPSPVAPDAFNGYSWPAAGTLTSSYGWRWGRMHRGIDVAAPVGTPIHAAAPGRVQRSGWNSGGYGNLIDIVHPDGSLTRYAHNSRLLVDEGEYVSEGQQIAEMGSTGYSTGPHLHFEIHIGGGATNPMSYLPAR